MDKDKVRHCREATPHGASRDSAASAPQGRNAGRQPAPLFILIVEDEMLPAMLLESAVVDAGHSARKVARLSKAMDLARHQHFDAAVLDVNLAGESVFPLAALLRSQGVPFVFASGYGEAGVPREYRDCTVLQKPYSQAAFNNALQMVLQDSGAERTWI